MTRRTRLAGLVLACLSLGFAAQPVDAQQTVNLSLGRYLVRQDRSATDILLVEHHDLAFDFRDFSSMSLGGEVLAPVRERYEWGLGASWARRTVRTSHVMVFNPDGSPIPRTLGLRQVPVALTVRVLPLGQTYRVQPYAGGGVAVVWWHFIDSGDFAAHGSLFRGEHYETNGMAVGPVLLFGLRVAGDALAIGMEGRYQRAQGSFEPTFARVRDADIDLHGWTINGTIGWRLHPD